MIIPYEVMILNKWQKLVTKEGILNISEKSQNDISQILKTVLIWQLLLMTHFSHVDHVTIQYNMLLSCCNDISLRTNICTCSSYAFTHMQLLNPNHIYQQQIVLFHIYMKTNIAEISLGGICTLSLNSTQMTNEDDKQYKRSYNIILPR